MAAEPSFPDDGILWRRWNEATLREIAEKDRPVVLFVPPGDPIFHAWPFVRAVFAALPANARLRELLKDEFLPLYVEPGELPEELSAFGAGSAYCLAVLSPSGLTPLVTFDLLTGDPERLVSELVLVLERLLASWG